MIVNIMKSKVVYPTIGLLIAIVGLLWGQGFLLRPKVSISCGAIDYNIPAQYQIEILSWKMMMSPEELQKEIVEKLSSALRERGLSEGRIKLAISTLQKKDKKEGSSKVEWKPYEQNIIKAAVSKMNAEFMPTVLQKYMELPDGALFFEIDNDGCISAGNPHIVIRLAGTVYKKPLVDSDNKITGSVTEGSVLSFDLDRIAPGSKTRGIIWYSHINMSETLRSNEISISFDRGTVRKQFSENKFFMSSRKEK
ncbi:MAG: hypothetical protein A4E64_00316 [Syntrophorhabdus sp. PtaU1.Bin058]|nr:MAG: hypothetical protein A4E64_00316 [Syntrophorhabdus sp. PtaU1.Bin058]